MKPPRAAGGKDDGFRPRNENLLRLHVLQDCARAAPGFVQQQLDCRREVHNFNAAVQDLVSQRAHDFRTRVVLCRVHALSRRAAAVGRDHRTVRRLVKLDTEVG